MADQTNPLGGATIVGPKGHIIHLPPAEKSVGPYRKALIESGILYTSTHFGTDSENKIVKGKVIPNGTNINEASANITTKVITQAEAKEYARNAGKRLLATIHAALGGDLSRVVQVIKLTGFVNGVEDFEAHGAVISGCSELLIEAFGEEIGTGARVCTGAGSLGCCCTCDLEVRVKG